MGRRRKTKGRRRQSGGTGCEWSWAPNPDLGFHSKDPEWQRLSVPARQVMSVFRDLDIFEDYLQVLAASARVATSDPVDPEHEMARIEAALDEVVSAGHLEIWLGRLPATFWPATPVRPLKPIELKDRLRLVNEDGKWVLHDLKPADEIDFGSVTNQGKRMLGRVYAGTEEAVRAFLH
jgi:hypothetical protein